MQGRISHPPRFHRLVTEGGYEIRHYNDENGWLYARLEYDEHF